MLKLPEQVLKEGFRLKQLWNVTIFIHKTNVLIQRIHTLFLIGIIKANDVSERHWDTSIDRTHGSDEWLTILMYTLVLTLSYTPITITGFPDTAGS